MRVLARGIIRFCDWMNGYHGQEINEAFIAFATLFPVIFAFMLFAVRFS